MFPEATQLVCGEVGTHSGLSDSKTHGLYQDIFVLIILGDSAPLFCVSYSPTCGLDWLELDPTVVDFWLFHTSSSHVGEEGERWCPRANGPTSPGGTVRVLCGWERMMEVRRCQ